MVLWKLGSLPINQILSNNNQMLLHTYNFFYAAVRMSDATFWFPKYICTYISRGVVIRWCSKYREVSTRRFPMYREVATTVFERPGESQFSVFKSRYRTHCGVATRCVPIYRCGTAYKYFGNWQIVVYFVWKIRTDLKL